MKLQMWKYFNFAVKSSLILGFVATFVFELPTTQGKGMELRAPFFVLGALSIYLVSRFKKWAVYPHVADTIFTIPFLLDTYGNIFGFFDSWRYYDDLIHTINWTCLVLVFQLFSVDTQKTRINAIMWSTGFGALLIILWEIAEWFVSIDGLLGLKGLRLSYEDTIGDLFMSTVGGVIGAILGSRFVKNN
jgi:hypothetical protein